jgi:hypothetical protein
MVFNDQFQESDHLWDHWNAILDFDYVNDHMNLATWGLEE